MSTAQSGASVAELVRLDLVHREASGDFPSAFYTGPTAILDLYDLAMDLTCAIRAVIEDMQIGDGTVDKPTLEAHHAAARQRTKDEQLTLERYQHRLRSATPPSEALLLPRTEPGA